MRLITKLTIYTFCIVLLPMLITYELNRRFSFNEIENQNNANLQLALQGFQLELDNIQEELFQKALRYSRLSGIKLYTKTNDFDKLEQYLLEIQENFGEDLLQINDRAGICLTRVGEWTSISPANLPKKIPNIENRAYFEEDLEDRVIYLKSSAPIFEQQSLVGYITIGQRMNRDLMWKISKILSQEVFLFYNGRFLTGTTDPFKLPLELTTPTRPIKADPIQLKHFFIHGQRWNVVLKPIIQKGAILGYFGASYPLYRVRETYSRNNKTLLWVNLLGIFIGLAGALWLVKDIKGSLFGMEPKEIANLLSERTTLLQSTHEGIIAVDRSVKITLINAEAQRMFNLTSTAVGQQLNRYIPKDSPIIQAIREKRALSNQQLRIGRTALLYNLAPVYHQRNYFGAIVTFRDLTELNSVAEELTAVKTYSEGLRSQTHEYKNKLHTISGLIQMNCLDEALHLIHQTFSIQQQFLNFVIKAFPNSQLSGLLIGKFNRGSELGIKMEITKDSFLKQIPPGIYISDLVCIIGNLIENAYDALQKMEAGKKVIIKIKNQKNSLLIKVYDNGPGIPVELQDQIFRKGFTTKNDQNRGIGLFLVKQCSDNLKGQIKVYSRLKKETLFIVRIPLEVI